MKDEMSYLVAFNDGEEQSVVAAFCSFGDAVEYARERTCGASDGYYSVLPVGKSMRKYLHALSACLNG